MHVRRSAFLVTCVLLLSRLLVAQEATQIVGRVTTNDDGLSVAGAAVLIPALNLSSSTDHDGR